MVMTKVGVCVCVCEKVCVFGGEDERERMKRCVWGWEYERNGARRSRLVGWLIGKNKVTKGGNGNEIDERGREEDVE